MFTRNDRLDWASTRNVGIIRKDIASSADYIIEVPKDDEEVNRIYLFKTEYPNLFEYTTDSFLPRDELALCKISFVLYEENNEEVYYQHDYQHVWRLMESPKGPWIDAISHLMLQQYIHSELSSSETQSETISSHNKGDIV